MTNIYMVQWKPGNPSQPNKRREEKLLKKKYNFYLWPSYHRPLPNWITESWRPAQGYPAGLEYI